MILVVLIDTQWNVNFYTSRIDRQACLVLIDTQWNVNTSYKLSKALEYAGFNRYIVECKYTGGTPFLGGLPSFNRYIVECKSDSGQSYIRAILVLIDTQWNVNFTKITLSNQQGSVLIDTQWNVNNRNHTCKKALKGFNRYIVECK